MSINVACPTCGQQYNVKDEAAGKRFQCKECQTVVDIPANSDADDELTIADFGEPIPAPARRRKVSPSDAAAIAAAAAAEQTRLPAIGMYVVCGISIGAWISRFVLREFVMDALVPGVAHLNPGAERFGHGPDIAVDVFLVFREIFIIYAFSRLQTVTSYSVAFAGAIIAVIPCVGSPCCILGMPFGVWALVLLNDPAVKDAFR